MRIAFTSFFLACLLLQNAFAFALQEAVVEDLKELVGEILVPVAGVEGLCTENFLRLKESRPENNIESVGFIGGGYYTLNLPTDKPSEQGGLSKGINKIIINNILDAGGKYIYDFEKGLFIYSGIGKRGVETSFSLWRVEKDKKGILIYSATPYAYKPPLCIKAVTYDSEPEPKKRLPICKPRSLGHSGELGEITCVLQKKYEAYLDEW